MKFAFLCDTPFQVFNSLNFIYKNMESSRENSDMYIVNQFFNAEKIYEQVKKTGLFKNVYLVKNYYGKPTALNKLRTLKNLLVPNYIIKKNSNEHVDIKKQNYDVVVAYTPIYFTVHFLLCCKNARLYFLEDGTGSYNRDIRFIINDNLKKLYRLLAVDVHEHPEKLYLYNPDLCVPDLYNGEVKILSLPKFNPDDENWNNIMKTVFSYDDKEDDIYKNVKLIYLNQPWSQTVKHPEEYKELELGILELIKEKNAPMLVRLHPREKDKEIYEGYNLDYGKNIWELVSANCITDDHILISVFSTAQFNPAFLFDKKPALIFTYEIFKEFFPESGILRTIKLLERIIPEDKLFIPKTMDELDDILSRLLKKD